MYIINVNHDSVIKQICQFRGNAYLINETCCMVGTMKMFCIRNIFPMGKSIYFSCHATDMAAVQNLYKSKIYFPKWLSNLATLFDQELLHRLRAVYSYHRK